ncbi:hypothetical protein FHC51_02015 [Leclercia sp. EC_58]|uniref:restriction endonuclease subunit S n=1 Tax=Leclercia sp. EC_58 TaxID=2584090 RepID=UPI001C6FF606|nr:restriction endonuclease subunit S [Leclercia sp. EC_58]MBW9398621.1 hypothetical protein [Leclercia sp. EC_58]
MAKYKEYPEYKDSGVEWLGEIPESWSVSRLKHVASIYGRIGFRGYTVDDIVGEGEGAIVLSPSNIVDEKFSLEKKTFLRWEKYYESPEIIVTKNDILLVKTGSTYGKSTIIKDFSEPMTINPQMALIKEIAVEPRFLAYWFNTSLIKSKIGIVNTGSGMPTMTQENINNFPVLIPPNNLDVFIADFLDHETAKIDNLIEKQQQLIELLKEKRQAVISHAVTKGLNPDVPMKDSGVEWLGEVPKHWKCGYLRWYISVSSGTYLNNKEFETDESNDCMNPVIGGNGVMGFTSKTNDGNCLVVGRVGALCGNVHQIRRSCWVTDNALKIIYGCDFDVDYLEMYLKVLDLNKLANHNAQPLITGTMIKEQVAIIPPIDEQKNITKFIQSKVGKIDLLILKSSEAVDKIKERRTALISAAVTGKIDVRDWVAPDTQDIEASQEATA